MSSEALSEQSCVREGAGYDEVFPLGQDDPSASYTERVLFANSPFEEQDKDSDVDGSESDASRDPDDEESVEHVESPIRPIIGLDRLRKFVLPLMWMVNDFNSSIKRKHFDTLWERY